MFDSTQKFQNSWDSGLVQPDGELSECLLSGEPVMLGIDEAGKSWVREQEVVTPAINDSL